MKQSVIYGQWSPDLPPHLTDTLTIARNVYFAPNGYRPMRGFQAIAPALSGWKGGTAFIGSDKTASLLSGTATDLYRYSGGAWSSVLGSLTADRWRFSQFGDAAICVNGSAPVRYDLVLGTAATLGGSPPACDLVATVRDFVVVAGDPSDVLMVTWSGFNDEGEWTPATKQSGFQPMLEGGEVMGLAGGEYGLIIQRNRIVKMTYTADETVFQFDTIEPNIGCISKGSVVQAGRLTFFLSERGFMVCDGTQAKPIGNERVDRTFFGTYARADLVNLYAAIDPRNFLVIWAMPGNPGRLWIYNWALDRWTDADYSNTGIFSGFTANVSIDALDALYPGGIDTIPYSIDAAIFAGGDPLLFLTDNTGAVGTLTGDILSAKLQTAFFEPQPGRRARGWMARPIGDALAGTLTIDARARLGDDVANVASSEMAACGDVPIRANGRYWQSTWEPSGDWAFVQGVEFDHAPGERR